MILEPLVEQELLSSGVSAPSAWGQVHMGKKLPCIHRGPPSLEKPSEHEKALLVFHLSSVCVHVERVEFGEGEEYRF